MEDRSASTIIREFKKKDRLYLIITIICVLITIFGIAMNWYENNKEVSDKKQFLEAQNTGEYCKINAEIVTESFASYGSENDKVNRDYYYIVQDSQYFYIVSLSTTQFKNLKPLFDYTYSEAEEPKKPEPIEISGISKKIPTKLKEFTIEYYNEMMQEEIVNSDNFEDYFGKYYLDCKETPETQKTPVWLMVAFIAGIIGIVFFFVTLRNMIKTFSSIQNLKNKGEYDTFEQELESTTSKEYKKIKTIVTQNFLVSYYTGMEIIKLEEIAWIYPFQYKRNGVTMYNTFIVITKDKKKHEVAQASSGGVSKEEYDQWYDDMFQKLPDILYGYTKENKKAMKTM